MANKRGAKRVPEYRRVVSTGWSLPKYLLADVKYISAVEGLTVNGWVAQELEAIIKVKKKELLRAIEEQKTHVELIPKHIEKQQEPIAEENLVSDLF